MTTASTASQNNTPESGLRTNESAVVPSMNENKYQHLYVIIEHEEGKPIPVSLEMLGEARRLMDDFNRKYFSSEKVIAVVLGYHVRNLCEELIIFGADGVIYAESPELEHPRNFIDTKVICDIAKNRALVAKISQEEYSNQFRKPRYMFFAADNTGRHLSSTVMAELESGLASDINKLVIEDLEIRHEHKTKGQPIKYEKTLEMYRPDFSGFLWTTILCLDNNNPAIKREYHPQACSIIPGVFQPLKKDTTRKGVIVDYAPSIQEEDLLKIKILSRKVIKSSVDFDKHKSVVSFGRGIKDSPEDNIKLIEELGNELDAEIGVSLPISKRPYNVSEKVSSRYFIPDRVIGTSGRKVTPLLYIAAGISGAMQHLAGMKESEFVVAINPDENSPIKDESDIFIKGKIEDVIPMIINELRDQKRVVMEVQK